MASDYARIRKENLHEYGHGTRHLELLAGIYPDRTHFVFEILQNAEDAEATRVQFRLYEDRLEVWHDGREFDEDDVHGVCGIGETTKAEDLTRIGKFGVGFKSVWAYTARPEIHSANENFYIERFIQPFAAEVQPFQGAWTTRFVLPFNHAVVRAEQAFGEIRERLTGLHARTLLFLRNISMIEWQVNDGALSKYWRREHRLADTLRRCSLVEGPADREPVEEWLVFERSVLFPGGHQEGSVEIAFMIEPDGHGGERVVPVPDASLVVFFPTDKRTLMGFLIQGPYRTTLARDNVPHEDDWNRRLVEETAALLADSLPALRERGLGSVSLLQALPTRWEDRYLFGMFRPIYDRVVSLLKEQPLLPAHGGSFINGKNAKLARSTELCELLPPPLLQDLFATRRDLAWVTDEITQDKTPALHTYVAKELEVQEITPEDLARQFSLAFVEKQTDEWLVRFYQFLSGRPALWRPGGPLRNKAFVRLQNQAQVTPFNGQNVPNAYLPAFEALDFPTVKRSLCDYAPAVEFLQSLGLTEPDVVADVLQNVLPKYTGNDDVLKMPAIAHQQDIQKITRALKLGSDHRRSALITQLQTTPFLRATNAGNGKWSYRKPIELYVRSPNLERYFLGNEDARFVDEAAASPEAGAFDWTVLGVESKPRRVRFDGTLAYEEKCVLRRPSGHTRDLAIDDYEFDGLAHFLQRLSGADARARAEGALVLWELLLAHLDGRLSWNKPSFFQGEYRWMYYSERSAQFEAAFSKRLRTTEWLVAQDGSFHRPDEMSPCDLPDGFTYDEALVAALRMMSDVVDTLARERQIRPELLRFALDHPDLLEDLMTQHPTDEISAIEADPGHVELNYQAELESTFDRRGNDGVPDPPLPRGAVPDPAGRREKTREAIVQARDGEPPRMTRFHRVSARRWEERNNEVRVFLEEEYSGRCQICHSTFLKRDGRPYFEGVCLVSRTQARWIDRPGNVLCLCATCSAKFLHGSVEAADIVEQVQALQTERESGNGRLVVCIQLCSEEVEIRFSERHMIDLQELINSSSVKA